MSFLRARQVKVKSVIGDEGKRDGCEYASGGVNIFIALRCHSWYLKIRFYFH